MATQLFLRNSGTSAINYFMDLSTTRGVASRNLAVNTATTASGTNINFLRQSGQNAEWISGRSPAGGWTLAGTVTVNLRAFESNMSANAGGRLRLYKRTAAGSESEIGGSPWDDGAEFGTSDAAMNWTFTPTSTAFAEDDRLVARFFMTNVGTMASGFTCNISYDGPTAAAAGDSYITLNETVAFKANDPFDVIIHFNGTDGSTTFPVAGDVTFGNLSVSGNAQVDTAQSVFGGAAALFDGTGDALAAASADNRHPLWCFGRSNPFTIDFRVRPAAVGSAQSFFSLALNTADTFVIAMNASNQLIVFSNSEIIAGGTMAANTWYHAALTLDSSNNMRLFLDGTQVGSTFDASDRNWDILQAGTSLPEWGQASQFAQFTNGWIDEFRCRVGEAVWTANFTPPSVEYGGVEPHAGAATFQGAGALSAAARLNMQAAATLPGTSSLSAEMRANMRIAATLQGAGSLSAQVTKFISATFAGAGSLSVDATVESPAVAHQGEATFQGAGALSVETQKSKLGSATFEGAGSLSVLARLGNTAAATFAGSGALSVAMLQRMAGLATFQGAGSLSVETQKSKQAAATFQGAGSLSALALTFKFGEATFQGAGSMSVLARLNERAFATFEGAGSLSIATRQNMRALATFQGAGDLRADATQIAAGGQVHQGQATFEGAGNLSALARTFKFGEATFQGAGSLQAAANLNERAFATFQGSGSLSVETQKSKLAAATFQGAGSLSILAVKYKLGEATFNGNGTLSVLARLANRAFATFEGSGSVSALANLRMRIAATFQGEGSLSAAWLLENVKQGQATFQGAGSLSANVTRHHKAGFAIFEGAGSISVAARLRQAAFATLDGLGSLSVSLRQNNRAHATLQGEGTMSVQGVQRIQIAARFAGAGDFSVLLSQGNRAAAIMEGVGSLQADSQIFVFGEKIGEATFAGAGTMRVEATVFGPRRTRSRLVAYSQANRTNAAVSIRPSVVQRRRVG